MEKDLSGTIDREILKQLSVEQLVEMVISQAIAIEKFKERILELEQQVEKLKLSRDLDSKISSKPPSSDLLKKSENKIESSEQEASKKKRKPGGQPGHKGKTRQGFERVDRYVLLKADGCLYCGQQFQQVKPEKIETQQVAQLVKRPIEIVEYQRHHMFV